MTLTESKTAPFDLDALERGLAGPLAPARGAALQRVRERGLPGAKDEAWRFTSLAPITRGRFERAAAPEAATLAAAERRVTEALGPGSGPRVVVVNGSCGAASSTLAGVQVVSLAANTARADLLKLVGSLVGADAAPFAALNLAALEDALVVHVTRGTVVAEPVTVVHVTAPGKAPLASHPRLVVALEEGAQATVVEVHLALEPGKTAAPRVVQNGVTELLVGENARLEHVLAQLEDDDGARVHTVQASVARDGGLNLHAVQLGGRLVRNDLRVLLDGPGAEARLAGVYVPRGGQHVDNHVWVEHAKPHGTSAQLFKGVIAGDGHAVFDGQVHVREDAQKTSAQQTNRNLLLSDAAVVNANPRLTIHADDVKCSHGSTVGQLDQDALFYLRARGLSKEVARGMLTVAFAGEVLDGLPVAVRGWLGDLVRARLAPEGLPADVKGEA
jgi:Fe-S cluster assembly protein SufD